MSRLTDERIDEILRPKDLMGETELESLAREVRELRHKLKEAEASGMLFSPVEMVQQIERLTRERDEANRTIDLQSRQISHQARQCQEIENERDAARKFNRRFRSFFRPTMKPDIVKYGCHGPCEDRDKLIDDYDATQTQQPQPTKTELVPWTAETRPRGVVMCRDIDNPDWEYVVRCWSTDGFYSDSCFVPWDIAFKTRKWSRDGVTWERCGVTR